MVFCENVGQAAKIAAVRENLERVQHVILMEGSGTDGQLSFEALRHEGVGVERDELERRSAEVTADDPYTMLFVDSSRPGRRRWCAGEACGNRARTKAYRHRRRERA